MEQQNLIIEAQGLGKRVSAPDVGELSILRGVSLAVKPGDAIAVLGASGSGKSTLLGLLAGLDSASDGEVRLFGQPLSGLDENQRSRLRLGRVGFVFQSFQLMPGMTALENVQLPLRLAGKASAGQAETLLEEVGLKQRMHHRPSQLSGGEQQRVAIARAFAGSPELLLADEPTGNLDTATGRQIIDLLFALRDRSGTALVLVTHDQQLAKRCDRVIELSEGTLKS
ncbi:MAG: ABC transporter ATP-binding protein [bacterium]